MHKPGLRPVSLKLLRRGSHPRQPEQHVHFHQGPQGHPAPCYDSNCPNPRLSV